MKQTFLNVLLLLTLSLATSCQESAEHPDTVASVFVPAQPSYADSTMWHIALNDTGTGADVFYVVSTWEFDWHTDDGIVSHHADPSNPEHRSDMDIEISQVAQYMADGNNFYAPFYRHITLNSWATLNEDTINRRYFEVAFVDVKNAFDYYMTHYNNGRPFILAGFSQGGKSVVELLKTLPEDTRLPPGRRLCTRLQGYPRRRSAGTVDCRRTRLDRHGCNHLLQLRLRREICKAHRMRV